MTWIGLLHYSEKFRKKPRFIRSKHHHIPRQFVDESQFYFLKAQDVTEYLTGSNDDLEFEIMV